MTIVFLLLLVWLLCVAGLVHTWRGYWLAAMWASNGLLWAWAAVLFVRATS